MFEKFNNRSFLNFSSEGVRDPKMFVVSHVKLIADFKQNTKKMSVPAFKELKKFENLENIF